MKLGATSFINSNLSVEEFLSILVSQGLQYVELKCDWRVCDPEVLESSAIKEWQELLQSYGLQPSLHACYIDLNLASLSKLIRTASIKRMTKCVQLASELEASYVTIHPGKFSRDHPSSLFPKAFEWTVRSIQKLLPVFEERNVLLALENAPNGSDRGVLTDLETMKAFLEIVDSQVVRILVDFGHIHTHGLDPLSFLRFLAPHVCAVHIHNNDGQTDSHQPLGEGTLNYLPILKELVTTYANFPILLEMHQVEDLLASRDYLRKNGI